MPSRGNQWKWATARLALAGLMLGACLAGCHRVKQKVQGANKVANPGVQAKQEVSAKRQRPGDPRLYQTFKEATHEDPPPDFQRPPDTTMAGKSVGKLYSEVVRLWDTIKFVTEDGRQVAYSATLETDHGNIEITLRPEWAPQPRPQLRCLGPGWLLQWIGF